VTRPKIGFVLGPEAAGLTRQRAAQLEGTGCDSLWVGGHVVSAEPASEVVTSLAWLAAQTEQVTVGSAVLVLPLHSPVVIAKQFAELDRASGGRIVMGVGSGSDAAESAACGTRFAGRGAQLDASIEIIRALWRGEKVTDSTPDWDLKETAIAPLPHVPGGPPILVAGRKSAAMRRAATAGDGWVPSMYSPAAYARSVAEVTAHADGIGRVLDGFGWGCLIYVRVDDDGAAATNDAVEIVAGEMNLSATDTAAILARSAAVGTVDDVAARLQDYVDAGVDHLLLRCCGRTDTADQIKRIMDEVAPRLARILPTSAI
jgi:alkanesulfonate monooxygenase SsuD/methylene tetrahydromethanopterin reductase-like flavin-dependent oxidoreductase (luciferase family)